jgi:membrane-bound serine protease (ClpP class)
MRLIMAVVSTALEEAAIWALWRFLLPEFDINLHVGILVGVMAAWGIFSIWLFLFTTRALKKQTTVGLPSMVGAKGKAAGSLNPEGMVKIRGELWSAVAEQGNIAAGEEIIVTGENGLKLLVRKSL